jgi:hypothetical protein
MFRGVPVHGPGTRRDLGACGRAADSGPCWAPALVLGTPNGYQLAPLSALEVADYVELHKDMARKP